MKKGFLLFILFIILATALTFIACEEEVSSPPPSIPNHDGTEGLEFHILNDTECAVSVGNAFAKREIVVPSKYKNYTVTKIHHLEGSDISGFTNCQNLTAITLPNTLTEICDFAFKGCFNLTSITIPPLATSIGAQAFSGCKSLTTINLPSGITSIGYGAFESCESLTTMAIPTKVIKIEANVFKGCTSLENLTFSKAIESIGISAFEDCKNLKTFAIPNKVEIIEAKTFKGCYNLTTLTAPIKITAIGEKAFSGCEKLTGFAIPDGLTVIGDYAFENCTAIEEIHIPKTVITMGKGAFTRCENLKSMTIPFVGANADGSKGATFFGYIFDASSYLNNAAKVPKTLHSLTVSAGTKIARHAFENCANLKSITLTGNENAFEEYAFNGCSSLSNLTFSSALTQIDKTAFYGCYNLENITVSEDSETFKSIDGNLYSKDGTILIKYAVGKEDTVFTLPESVTTIEEKAFDNAVNLTSLALSQNLVSVKNNAFNNCVNLANVSIPSTVATIGENVFDGCASIENFSVAETNAYFKSLDGVLYSKDETTLIRYPAKKEGASFLFPKATTVIKAGAFMDNVNILEITIPDTVSHIGIGAFKNCALTSITLPFTGSDVDGTLGTNFGYIFGAPQYRENKTYLPQTLKKVVITNCTEIPTNTFFGCATLTEIQILNVAVKIRTGALVGCDSLESLTIPFIGESLIDAFDFGFGTLFGATEYESYTTKVPSSLKNVTITAAEFIDDLTFARCYNIIKITLPETVKSIGKQAFFYCESLAEINIPEGPTVIAEQAFAGCKKLVEITIPFGVERIEDTAFSFCNNLKKVTMADSVNYLSATAFYMCAKLEEVKLSSSLTTIYPKTFQSTGLVSIVIPEGITSIGESAFEDCLSLVEISLAESVENIGESAFDNTGFFNDTSNWIDDVLYIGKFLLKATNRIKACNVKEGTLVICNGAFKDCIILFEITIPKSVVSLNANAFMGCKKLHNVTFEENSALKRIEPYAFGRCMNIYDLTLPDELQTIEESAFYYCTNLRNIEIPDSVTHIGEKAFNYCTSLKSITLPKYITSIEKSTFQDCINLAEIILPDGLTEIKEEAFLNCRSLTKLDVTENLTSIISSAFDGSGFTLDPNSWQENGICYAGTILVKANRSIEACDIREGTTHIANQAFSYHRLTSVTMPDSLTTICRGAFANCYHLDTINLSQNLTSLGDSAFSGCSALTTIYLPEKLSHIGTDALGCSALASIEVSDNNPYFNSIDGNLYTEDGQILIRYAPANPNDSFRVPEEVREIGDYAFRDSDNLSNVILSNNVEIIGRWAFFSCSKLNGITLPSAVKCIESCAFMNCYFNAMFIPETVTELQSKIFAGYYDVKVFCEATSKPDGWAEDWFEDVYTQNVVWDAKIASVDSALYIVEDGEAILTNYSGDAEIFTIPTTVKIKGENYPVTTIDSYAFTHSNLNSIIIHDGITTLRQRAFEHCKNLQSITIPDSVTTIEGYVFNGCINLIHISIGSGVTYMGPNVFLDTAYYNHSPHWEDKLLYIGTYLVGVTKYFYDDAVIKEGTTLIPRLAFYETVGVQSVHLPASLKIICSNAFMGCKAIMTVTVAENSQLAIIEGGAFWHCTALTEIFIPESVSFIGSNAFFECENLTIYCEAKFGTKQWHVNWNASGGKVIWNYVKEEQ